MNTEEKMKKMLEIAKKIQFLLEDPQPGLSSWRGFLGKNMDELKDLWYSNEKELKPEEFTHSDAVRAIKFWTVIYTERGGYVEGEITLHRFPGGGITISEDDGSGFISIHDPNSIKALKDFLNTELS